ncbi:hypothetical protein GCM10011415_11510 [Salipiger pallidus]|uniref:Transposase n=1 Tax=Salipiger pallidus TaxID=1775170 RepID=A0A8J2ZHU4_9RHOB|nr:hypothetical protein GCM10011415_11510 [Salipiger pallidus]
MATASFSETPVEALADTIAGIEDRLGARVGLSLVDAGSGWSWSHRRFRRYPCIQLCANGTELTSNAILKWQKRRRVAWHCIAPAN